jgi:hypothetical protein
MIHLQDARPWFTGFAAWCKIDRFWNAPECDCRGREEQVQSATGNLKDNRTMLGIQFVTDEKGRRVAVQIDLKKHAAI